MKKYLIAFFIVIFATISSTVMATDINRLSPAEQELGFELLFDGTVLCPLTWQGSIEGYPVKSDKTFVCEKGGQLLTKKQYDNFIFRFEFKLPPRGNNGVGIRTEAGRDSAYYGMEIQILSDAYSEAQDWQKHGSIYGIVPAKTGALKPDGEWNQEEIIAIGPHIIVTVNGKIIVDADITNAKPIHKAEHPGLHNKTGFIGFLGHGDPVAFRSVRVLKIADDSELDRVRRIEKRSAKNNVN